ncbi:PfkB family carbohydrate kinase [Parapedobacter koreensis]|uniref:Sugar or nucleoside kinase, ribokinase family n=1 Tax=Parapedobacter koreensis TaxID=332977 RepID=A0A1H7F6H4_9SPHI|nr:PfkB family carbohydrate kinase [Parapedobacter koreensis]SEK21689.1 Sugar or nucleoside kinase, ribokinase family [Parapedobacter koreensis]
MGKPHNDICCIGHATVDRVITPESVHVMPGGTAYYFSSALKAFDISLSVATSFAQHDSAVFDAYGFDGEGWVISPGRYSHFFENEYNANRDYRKQRVLSQGDPLRLEDISAIRASWYHFGPLLAGDISEDLVDWAAGQGKVSLDIQGCIRKVEGVQVVHNQWDKASSILPLVTTLKANYEEARLLTGFKRIKDSIKYLEQFGVEEIIITLGSNGAIIHEKGQSRFIPAFFVQTPADTTGCGDTFMAGYLYSKLKGANTCEAGRFAAAMAALKTHRHGPFVGSPADVQAWCNTADSVIG